MKDKNERRLFLKQSALTTAGIGAAMSSLSAKDPVMEKMYAKFTSDHVNTVMNKISSASPNDRAALAFSQTMDNIVELYEFETDHGTNRVMSMAKGFLKNIDVDNYGIDTDGFFGLPQALSNCLVGAYLASIDKFNFGEYTSNELRRSFDLVRDIEPDFLPIFAEKIEYQLANDANMAEKFATIGEPNLRAILKNNRNMRDVSKIDPVTVTWVVIGVVTVVVAVFAVLFGEKR